MRARVRAARDVAARVRLLELEPPEARRYPPGAHLDLWLPSGDKRSYSLVGARPHDGAYRIAVKQLPDSRGGSEHMHSLAVGDELEIAAPASHFELRWGAPEYLLIAAGIGVTPIIGMAQRLVEAGAPVRMLYSGHARGEMAFVDELSELLGDRLTLHVTDEGTRLEAAHAFEDLEEDADVYLCGPYGFQEAIRAAWRDAERPPTNLRFETFAASGAYPNEPFTVHVADYDVDVEVPVNRSMLEALRAAGVNVMYDCLRGECGLCAVDILEADCQIDHRDVFLSDAERAERKKICTCVSRALRGGMTVDTGYRGGALRGTTTIVQPAGRAFMETGGGG
jgi:vanillate O-demethylase ferredoxin subunit